MRLLVVAGLLLLPLTAACPQSSTPSEPPTRQAPDAGHPAAEKSTEPERQTQQVIYPEPDPGDIASEVNNFRNLKACRARLRDALPRALGELIGDIGYTDAVTDACRTLESLAARSIERCQRLELRAARLGCRRRYAMFHGEPDQCPPEMGVETRDPVCVAVAMRDPSMCQAAITKADIGRCRAIVLRSERPCRVAHSTALAAGRCAADARRWWNAIPPRRPRPALPLVFEPSLTLCPQRRVTAPDASPSAPADGGADAGAWPCRDHTALIRRGIVLRPAEGLVIGGREGQLIGPRPPLVELKLPQPSGELPLTFTVGDPGVEAWVDLDPEAVADESLEIEEGEIEIEQFNPERGAVVAGTTRLTIPGAPDGVAQVEGRFRSFLRDIIPQPEAEASRKSSGSTRGSSRSGPRGRKRF